MFFFTYSQKMKSINSAGAITERPDYRMLKLSVLFFFLSGTAFHLILAYKGYHNYRAQHLGPAINYAQGNIDLMNPVIVGFNAGDTPTPLELPLWQATAALLFKGFGTWTGWANVASLLFGIAALWPLFKISKAYGSERVAWWTLIIYSSLPLTFYYNGRACTDGSSITFTLWFLYFADLMVRTREWRWLLPSMIFGALSALSKAPFFFCAGICSFLLLLVHSKTSLKSWVQLSITGLVAGLLFMLWTKHTDAAIAKAEFPLVDLRTSGGSDDQFMKKWYFGDWHYKLNPANWLKGGWRFLNANLGSFALLSLLLWGGVASRNRFGQMLFLAGGLTTLVFTHVVLHHSHYYLMFSPAVAILCGWAVAQIESSVFTSHRGRNGFVLIMIVGLFLSTIQGLVGMKTALDADPYPRMVAKIIAGKTSAEEKILIQGGGWGGEYLILAERRGLSIWDTKFLEKPETLKRMQELGYTKLVMISESPMLLAIQQSNPGQSLQQRASYRASITPVADSWPTVYKTEDVLIKEIPVRDFGK
jgi:hypothetical protein